MIDAPKLFSIVESLAEQTNSGSNDGEMTRAVEVLTKEFNNPADLVFATIILYQLTNGKHRRDRLRYAAAQYRHKVLPIT